MSDMQAEIATAPYEPSFGDYFALMKPRVMSLVVFTALVGLLCAPGQIHFVEAVAAIIFIAVGAGASGALNMWWDADIDGVMRRTQGRPIPSGRATPQDALAIGLTLSVFSVVMLTLATNAVAGGLLAFTIFFYVVIYTMWLKRSTPQNIVIGGAAGAFPPMIGWAAVTGDIALESCLMFALTFMWTPPHFWALALFTKADYSDASVPMLTVTHGRPAARFQIFVYSVLLAVLAVSIGVTQIGGPIYLALAIVLNAQFLWVAFQIWRRNDADSDADSHAAERRLFKLSLVYLFLHFGALLLEAALRPVGLGGWG